MVEGTTGKYHLLHKRATELVKNSSAYTLIKNEVIVAELLQDTCKTRAQELYNYML